MILASCLLLLVGLWLLVTGRSDVTGICLLALAPLMVLVFGSLTVTVDGEVFQFVMGSGLIRKRVPLTTLRSWKVVKSPWYYGWGIRRYPGGWLYRVSGLQTVELQLVSGKQFRVGSDEPEALCAALAAVAPLSIPVADHD